jgi:quinol monooxygenase YgiN
MYARSTTIQADPQKIDDGLAHVRDTVMPAVQEMDGCVGLSMLADRDSGRCIITTAWADEEAMRSSAEGVRSIRDRAAEAFGGQPAVQEWEIAVLHRMRDTGDGACARLVWSRAEPDHVDRTLDAYRMNLMPRLEELPGFCSVSLLVGRSEGRAVSAVTYESREAMERSREQATAMREEFATTTGVAITDVAEMDLLLAHLRVPETV